MLRNWLACIMHRALRTGWGTIPWLGRVVQLLDVPSLHLFRPCLYRVLCGFALHAPRTVADIAQSREGLPPPPLCMFCVCDHTAKMLHVHVLLTEPGPTHCWGGLREDQGA